MGKNKDFQERLNETLASKSQQPGKDGQSLGSGYLADREATIRQHTSRVYSLQRLVDPKVCRMWTRHNRFYNALDEQRCKDLIDSIRAKGKQLTPAIVRRLGEDEESGYEYEVIAGARRHWAVSYLRDVEHLEIPYFIEERTLTDEQAFVESDAENRERVDISDYERALDYKNALYTYYDGKISRLANRLEITRQHAGRLIALADLPDVVVSAMGGFDAFTERSARRVVAAIRDGERYNCIIERAEVLAEDQSSRRNAGEPLLKPAYIAGVLVNGWSEGEGAQRLPEVKNSNGERIAWVTRDRRSALSVHLSTRHISTPQALRETMSTIADELFNDSQSSDD